MGYDEIWAGGGDAAQRVPAHAARSWSSAAAGRVAGVSPAS